VAVDDGGGVEVCAVVVVAVGETLAVPVGVACEAVSS
jgi:hypothetical protein